MTEADDSTRADWEARVERCFDRVAAAHGLSANVLTYPDARTTTVTRPDWGAFPVRVARCLSRQSALEILDWRTERGDVGRCLQEEYLEWRVIRDDSERITRVEMTTELPDYWRSLAARDPGTTLNLVAQRAREASVPAQAVYGDLDPFAAGVSPHDRERAFVGSMLAWGAGSPYNNGQKAICCMIHPMNTVEALIELATLSAFPYTVEEPASGDVRCATSAEIIPLLGRAAQAGRNSDPVLVERIVRLAFEGRLLALAEPIGVDVQGVEATRLRLPDGGNVPPEWFTLERGAAAEIWSDQPAGYQRLVFEVPPGEHLSISDLIDTATEQPIRYGGQIADLVQLAVRIVTSAPGIVPSELQMLRAATNSPSRGCDEVLEMRNAFRRAAGSTRPTGTQEG